VLKSCKEVNLSLSNKKCFMILSEGIVLGHHISCASTKVDTTKIEVIVNLPYPKKQKEVYSFLGHDGYYRCFVEKFTRITCPLF
jgi:hypothetical protein